ncbi:MAG: Hsp20/alpha crystallin family protein [Planctomycetaceae bacterium]
MNLLSRFGGRLWDPWREMSQLQHEMGRLLNSTRPLGANCSRETPPVNVYASENEIVVTLEVPGIDPAGVEVTVAGSTVTITGERAHDGVEESGFHRRERTVGKFTRQLQLPFEVDPSQTEATYERGVLRVQLSRPESSRPRKITVKSV